MLCLALLRLYNTLRLIEIELVLVIVHHKLSFFSRHRFQIILTRILLSWLRVEALNTKLAVVDLNWMEDDIFLGTLIVTGDRGSRSLRLVNELPVVYQQLTVGVVSPCVDLSLPGDCEALVLACIDLADRFVLDNLLNLSWELNYQLRNFRLLLADVIFSW